MITCSLEVQIIIRIVTFIISKHIKVFISQITTLNYLSDKSNKYSSVQNQLNIFLPYIFKIIKL